MRARHARRRPPLLRAQVVTVFNGCYPQKVVLAPVLPQLLRQHARALAASIPTALLLGAGLVVLLLSPGTTR